MAVSRRRSVQIVRMPKDGRRHHRQTVANPELHHDVFGRKTVEPRPFSLPLSSLLISAFLLLRRQGWEYRRDSPLTECCGHCHQVACVTDDGLHRMGESWKPDLCTKSVCVMRDNRVRVSADVFPPAACR